MENKEDKVWATKYLLDPLTAPEPSQETGPGSHYSSTFQPIRSQAASIVDPDEDSQKSINSSVRRLSKRSGNPYPSPPKSASPQHEQFPKFDEATSNKSPRFSQASTNFPTSTNGHNRQSSISSRDGHDIPNGPLELARKNTLRAQRSPHLRKGAIPTPDKVDALGSAGFDPYHHEGPYDATLISRNKRAFSSPVEATMSTNQKALQATPVENIQDSVQKHRPLIGVASIPPGSTDVGGRTYQYEEGSNMMTDNGGNYKRWADMNYHPDDIKGKSEPAYTIEKSLKDHKTHKRNVSDGQGIEMTAPRPQHSRPRPRSSDSNAPPPQGQSYSEWERSLHRSSGERQHGSIRRKFGSLRI